MAEEVKYNNTLVSGRADETLSYTRYIKDESSGKSTKELLDEKVNKTDQLGTTQIADNAVTNEKLAEHSVDNSKLSPDSVSYEKIQDGAVITEKIQDKAVTTEKVEEKAITNSKLGDQSVDGRVVREASLESKHFANESVTTEKVARKSITKDKLADNSVDDSKVVDGSIGNAKLSPDSVTTEKIKDSSVTNEKVANDTLGIEKFDPELRKTIQAATGLPEDLSQMIQDVDKSVKQLHEKDTDLQSQVDDKQQQITANKSAQDTKNASLDENMKKLNTRDDQITETLKNISATGGASVASAVTYDNTTSQLTSANIQGAVDELQGAKIDKTSILQESGEAEDKVMSQKAVSAKFSNLFESTPTSALLRKQTISKKITTDALNTPNMDIVAGRAYKISAKTSVDIQRQVTYGIADDTQLLIPANESQKLVEGVSSIIRAKYSKKNSAFFFIFDGDTDVDVELTIEDVTDVQNTASIQQNTASIQQNTAYISSVTTVSKDGASGRKHLHELMVKKGHVYKISAKPSKEVQVKNIVVGFNRISDNSTVIDILQIVNETWNEQKEATNAVSDIKDNEMVYVKLYSATNNIDVDVELTIEDVTDVQNTASIQQNTAIIQQNTASIQQNTAYIIGKGNDIFSKEVVIPKSNWLSTTFNNVKVELKKGKTYIFELSANSTFMADYLYFIISSIASGSGGTDYANFNLLSTSKEWDGTKKTFHFTPSEDLQCFLRIVQNKISVGENNKIKLEYDTKVGRVYGLQERFNIVTTKQRYSLDKIEGISVIDKDIKKQCIYLEDKWYSDGKPVDILNPLYKYGADPDFIEVNGTFYIVASEIDSKQNGQIVFLRTKDWLSFEDLGNPIKSGDGPTDEQYWAPDIACVNNKYIIYMSANSPRRIIAYIADSPEGPYKYYNQDYSSGSKDGIVTSNMGLTLTDTTLIDPNFFEDPVSKKKYLFFGSYLSETGKCYGIEMSEDGLSIKSGAKTFCVSNIKAEGTNNFYKDGKYYLFCSIGAWGYSSYQTVYGVADSIEGPYLTKEGKSLSDADDPSYEVLTPKFLEGRLYGIGHNGNIFKDFQGRYYMVIHAWDKTDVNSEGNKTSRQICLVEIKWDVDGFPHVDNSTEYLKFPAPVLV